MSSPKNGGDQFMALMEALAEQAESASDQTILEEANAAGVDVRAEGERVRGVLAAAVLRAKKQRLHSAAAVHEQRVAAFKAHTARLPEAAADRRALLERTLNRRPDTRRMVMITMQHREFEELTDGDVESALRQLHALGLVDDAEGDE